MGQGDWIAEGDDEMGRCGLAPFGMTGAEDAIRTNIIDLEPHGRLAIATLERDDKMLDAWRLVETVKPVGYAFRPDIPIPVLLALLAGGDHIVPLALQDEREYGAATSRQFYYFHHFTFWPRRSAALQNLETAG